MKVLGIVGSNANVSNNRKLMQFVQKHFEGRYEIEIAEVKGIPLFKEKAPLPQSILDLAKKIEEADLVLISTPEYQHSVPSALRSTLEWLSCTIHPFRGKPVVIIGTSVLVQGSARGQSHLKMMFTAPGFGAHVFVGDEFMMGPAEKQFDKEGSLPEGTVNFLDHFFDEVDEFYAQVTK